MSRLGDALAAIERVVLGKPGQIRLCLACLLARGHLLIEDVPGVGKTTLAHTLAQVLGLDWRRLQFTSDLLPADVGTWVVLEVNGAVDFNSTYSLGDDVYSAARTALSARSQPELVGVEPAA